MYKETLSFLKALKKNNNKEWFDKNRNAYDETRAAFVVLVQSIINELKKTDKSLKDLEAKDCIFRINRDVRFSKDKSPYKTTYSAFIAAGGRKINLPGYYFHIEPDNQTIIGGGLYQPEPDQLKKIRSEIAYEGKKLKKILEQKEFKKIYPRIEGEKLVKVPKGFDEENQFAELLKHKNFFVMQTISDKDVLAGKLPKLVIDGFKKLKPFNDFIHHAIA